MEYVCSQLYLIRLYLIIDFHTFQQVLISISKENELKKRAYNGRWATLPNGIIPLTAADSDFPIAPEIKQGICDYLNAGYLSYGPFSGLDEFKRSVANHYNLRKSGTLKARRLLR